MNICKAFVTGGSGALGRNLLPALSGAGVKLRILRHNTGVPCGEAEVVDGDIRDFQPDWLQGVDVVFHLAAKTNPSGGDGSMSEVNVRGSERLVQAVIEAKHKPKLVFTSSVAVFGPSRDGLPMSNESSLNPITDYGRSKMKAEVAVLKYERAAVVRLPMVVGPGDRVTGRFDKLARMGFFPITRGRFCAIAVGDAVKLLRHLATSSDTDGRIYTVSDGEIYEWKDVARHFGGLHGRDVFTFKIPKILLLPRLFGLLGNSDAATYLKHDWICQPNFPDGFSIERKVFAVG